MQAAPLSGLVAMLAAARMLGNASLAAGSPAAASLPEAHLTLYLLPISWSAVGSMLRPPVQAANAPLSGLVAMLVAARMLGNASVAAGSPAAASVFQKRLCLCSQTAARVRCL